MYIDFIADYGESTGHEDLAFSEVALKLCEQFSLQNLPFPMVRTLSVRPFNTIETGFVVAQLAFNSKLGKNHLVYHNTAPRKDVLEARDKNAGEFLAVAELPNKVRIIGVFGGFTFSFLKGKARIYRVQCAKDGSQFRSRDVFPPCVASLAAHADQPLTSWPLLGEEVTDIKEVPSDIVLSIDGYGNIKTNVTHFENINQITLNEMTRPVQTGQGIFSVPDGQMVFAPGSSGWEGQTFGEICLRGGSAARVFHFPQPGQRLEMK